MADSKLERLRAALREEADKKNSNGKPGGSSGGDHASYPFYNIPDNAMATVRFLPDADDENLWFWVERQTIKLSFDGVVGGDYPTSDQVTVTVPCVDMFGDSCPIIAHTKPWWREVNGQENPMKATAKRYWKKKSYITQGFVVSSPFEEKDAPENPIRRLILGSSLLEKIKAGLADPDMENHPTDYLNGCDFRIRKTKKQDYNNYDTSEWARRSRPLSEAEHLAIQQHGLFDLKGFKGARPDAEGISVIKAMFHASLAGEPFDYAAFGQHYRPYGGGRRNDDAAESIDSAAKQPSRAAPARAAATQAMREDVEAVEASLASPEGSGARTEPQELLAKLRARTTASRA